MQGPSTIGCFLFCVVVLFSINLGYRRNTAYRLGIKYSYSAEKYGKHPGEGKLYSVWIEKLHMHCTVNCTLHTLFVNFFR
ncbi:hypothetical protein EDC01DRAFT_638037 [Geopyxis carbonaria]|nr:hypothetical protein EDC01DRAFT_638037 [Geopyxis carbonaria]